MESELGGGDWRPFLFFERMSLSEKSGNAVAELRKFLFETGW
jgi:hypothetical protein